MSTPLRIEITDDAQAQIAAVEAWWAENRPAAPGAVLEELDRILSLLVVQPDMGTRARRAALSGVRRVTLLSRIPTTCTTEWPTTPSKCLPCGTPAAGWGQACERSAADLPC